MSKCNRDRWIGAAIVPSQGADEYEVAEQNDVICSGFTDVLVTADNESGISALKESAVTALKLAGVKVKAEESALYDSQSNGLAESAVTDGRESNQDGRTKSSLVCSTRALRGHREACTRFEQSDVARPQNELTSRS